jgi:hypothetical protein
MHSVMSPTLRIMQGSNGSVFSVPEVDENMNRTGTQQNPNMDWPDQQTSNPETGKAAHSMRQWHPFFASEVNPFSEFYGPYQDIYGNQDVYGDPYIGKAMHDYIYNQCHPERTCRSIRCTYRGRQH